jgi:hypothetical protein
MADKVSGFGAVDTLYVVKAKKVVIHVRDKAVPHWNNIPTQPVKRTMSTYRGTSRNELFCIVLLADRAAGVMLPLDGFNIRASIRKVF